MTGDLRASRRNWAMAIPGLAIVGVCATLLYLDWERHRDLLGRPAAVAPASLSTTACLDQLPSRFVTLPVRRQLDTGVQLERTTSYGLQNIVCDYVVIAVADRWMVAEIPSGFKADHLTGYLTVWETGAAADALRRVREKIDPESIDKLLPYQLEAGHDVQAESRLQLWGCAGGILFGLLLAALLLPQGRPHSPYATYPQLAPAGGWPGRRQPAR